MEQVLKFDKLTTEHWRQLVSPKQALRYWAKHWKAVRWLHDYHRA